MIKRKLVIKYPDAGRAEKAENHNLIVE